MSKSAIAIIITVTVVFLAWLFAPKPVSQTIAQSAGLIPVGKFSAIHRVALEGVDSSELSGSIASATCFSPATADADATLRVELFLDDPPGRRAADLGDTALIYKATLTAKDGRPLWKGSESSYQPIMPGPGVHLPAGRTFYKEISPSQALTLLLYKLRYAACAQTKH